MPAEMQSYRVPAPKLDDISRPSRLGHAMFSTLLQFSLIRTPGSFKILS